LNLKERPLFDEQGDLTELPDATGVDKGTQQKLPYFAACGTLGYTAVLSLLCALAFRGGLLLRLLGIGVVTGDGTDASRLRMLRRAFAAWSPVLFGGLALLHTPPMSLPLAASIVAILVAGVVIWSAALPGRSLPDRLAGTWLVPR
jgi:hypothetical protein